MVVVVVVVGEIVWDGHEHDMPESIHKKFPQFAFFGVSIAGDHRDKKAEKDPIQSNVREG